MKKYFKAAVLLLTAALLMGLLSGCLSQVSTIEFKNDGSVVFSSAQYVLEEALEDNNMTPGQYFSDQLEAGGQLESKEIKGNKYWGVAPESVTYGSLDEFITAMEDNNLIRVYEAGDKVVIEYKVESITIRGEEQSNDGDINLIPEQYQPMMVDELTIAFPGGLSGLSYPPENESLIDYYAGSGVVKLDLGLTTEEYQVVVSGSAEPGLTGIGDTAVESFDIKINKPEPGVKTGDLYIYPPECEPEVSCKVGRIESDKYFAWYLNDGSEQWKLLDYDDEFEAGKQYGVRFLISPAEGFYFDPEVTDIKINGGHPNNIQEADLEDRQILVLSYKFDPLPGKELTTPFTDVSKDDYYYDAVVWAYNAEPQITDGNGKDKFMPEQTCTRGQVVTFLWRAAGCPEPKTSKCPFTDVTKDDYFYKPVLWAVEKGITEGTTATTFSPAKTCTNAHILTFLYRAVGAGEDGWYEEALNWAGKNNIILGSFTGKYDVKADCPRKNVVYYLYRFADMDRD